MINIERLFGRRNMKKKIIRSLTIICASVILISCKSSNNEQENGNLSSAQIMTQSESDEAVSEMVSTDSQIVDTVKDVVKKLNDDTYEVSEIETDYTQEYYLKLVGETIPGKVLVVNTTEDKNYEEYQQFVPVNDEVYYVVHDKFFKDQQSYQDYVDAIKDDRTYSVPMIMDKSALYIQLLEYVELQAVEGTPYDRALKNVNISIANGRDWKIIGKAE